MKQGRPAKVKVYDASQTNHMCHRGEGKPQALPPRQPGGTPMLLVEGIVRKVREDLKIEDTQQEGRAMNAPTEATKTAHQGCSQRVP